MTIIFNLHLQAHKSSHCMQLFLFCLFLSSSALQIFNIYNRDGGALKTSSRCTQWLSFFCAFINVKYYFQLCNDSRLNDFFLCSLVCFTLYMQFFRLLMCFCWLNFVFAEWDGMWKNGQKIIFVTKFFSNNFIK